MKQTIWCAALFFVGFIGLLIFSAYMEAKTYNKLTGSNVTTWDAMFVTLRVSEGVKGQ